MRRPRRTTPCPWGWAGWAIESPSGARIYFGGDAEYGPVYADVAKRHGGFDYLLAVNEKETPIEARIALPGATQLGRVEPLFSERKIKPDFETLIHRFGVRSMGSMIKEKKLGELIFARP